MEKYEPRLKKYYREEVVPKLMEKFGYDNVMQVPRLVKIVLNRAVGKATQDKKLVDYAVEELTTIAGQRAVPIKAKRSVANFKLRKGMPIAAKVTLRRDRMWEFLDKLINAALPRVRDFKGVSDKSFDGRGNFNMGVDEQIIFPEIIVDKIHEIGGLDIAIVTTAKTDQEAYELLKELGFPFKNS